MRRFVLLLAAAGLAAGQNQPDAPGESARRFAAELKLDQSADAALFQRVGFDRAAQLLTAVMSRGQAVGATPREWADMHRAIAGLIELYTAKGELFRAAVFASVQELYYRNDEGDYHAALAAARQALRLHQQSGQTGTGYLYWKNIGEDLIHLGQLDEGVEALSEARRSIPDQTSPINAIVWREIIDGEIARGNIDGARRECDAFVEQARPPAPALFRGRALLARAGLQMYDGKYGDALTALRAARQELAGDQAAGDFEYEFINELLAIPVNAMHSLPYSEAAQLGGRIEREFPDVKFPVAAFARQVIDYRRRLAGEFDVLLRQDTAALEKAREAGDIPAQIEILRSLAVTYAFTNSRRQQITMLEQALDLEKSMAGAGGVPESAQAQYSYFQLLRMLGDAYADNSQTRKAGQCFHNITAGIDAISSGAAKNRLARIYADAELGKARVAELEGEPDHARDLLKQALHAPPNGPARFTRSTVLVQLARLERNLNQIPMEAVQRYEEAIQALHAEKDTRAEITARLQLARYLIVEAADSVPGAGPIAAEQLHIAGAAASGIEFADALWRVKFLDGMLAERARKTEAALQLYMDAVAKVDHLRAGLSQDEQRTSFMDNESIQELYHRLIALLTKSGLKQQAWEYLERGKARTFLEMLQGRRFRSSRRPGGSQELEALEKQILDLRSELSPAAAASRSSANDAAMLRTRLNSLESRFVAARQQSALRESRAGQELSLRPLTLAEVQAKLPAGTTLIEYSVLENAVTAFIIDRGSVVQAVWPAAMPELRARVQNARELLSQPDSGEELKAALESVSAILIAPLLPKIAAGTRTLLIVPAEFLNYLPFQALPCGGGQALIDRFAVAYLPSASTLAFLNRTSAGQGSVFLGALGNVAVDGMPPLPGTLREVRDIARGYPKAEIAVERAFTHARLERALAEHEAVHMATHGMLDGNSPLFNAVLTSPAEHQPSRLSLYELTDLRMRARLVVLSACETGLGELRQGDEVTGLTRTFLQAGADTVVSSLWSVNDRATAQLMKAFYNGLRRGAAPPAALRDAALSVRKLYAHPYYWAAFVSTGAR